MILVTGATGHVGRAVVSRLASLGHDVARDVQAASRRRPSGIALRVADYEDAFKDFTAITAENQRAFEMPASSNVR
ncbi:MAG: NAD-dependent epimerase/dehydratase family protein [Xanthobacteraceae bacterium]